MKQATFYIYYIFLFAIAVAGWFVDGFGGGIMFGFCLSMLLLASLGRRQAKKVEARMNKKMRDVIIQNQ